MTKDGIARAALGLLDRTGLDGLTMRLVAAELGVRAPTLYWHVKNKQELLDAIANLLVARANLGLEPSAPGQDWADWLDGPPDDAALLCRPYPDLMVKERTSDPWVRRSTA